MVYNNGGGVSIMFGIHRESMVLGEEHISLNSRIAGNYTFYRIYVTNINKVYALRISNYSIKLTTISITFQIRIQYLLE